MVSFVRFPNASGMPFSVSRLLFTPSLLRCTSSCMDSGKLVRWLPDRLRLCRLCHVRPPRGTSKKAISLCSRLSRLSLSSDSTPVGMDVSLLWDRLSSSRLDRVLISLGMFVLFLSVWLRLRKLRIERAHTGRMFACCRGLPASDRCCSRAIRRIWGGSDSSLFQLKSRNLSSSLSTKSSPSTSFRLLWARERATRQVKVSTSLGRVSRLFLERSRTDRAGMSRSWMPRVVSLFLRTESVWSCVSCVNSSGRVVRAFPFMVTLSKLVRPSRTTGNPATCELFSLTHFKEPRSSDSKGRGASRMLLDKSSPSTNLRIDILQGLAV
eukprot:comp62153_c0_seq1/m.47911 comp62153_c0_seq1/g.47911  ORF comp62153_c0_seq1/g.47911 comp62153_c0_seq1/m.47911 type:complete len:324 (+) comp62153_c0_seq1:3337-4308(+)